MALRVSFERKFAPEPPSWSQRKAACRDAVLSQDSRFGVAGRVMTPRSSKGEIHLYGALPAPSGQF